LIGIKREASGAQKVDRGGPVFCAAEGDCGQRARNSRLSETRRRRPVRIPSGRAGGLRLACSLVRRRRARRDPVSEGVEAARRHSAQGRCPAAKAIASSQKKSAV
jgi:hypothetical protein